LLFHQDSNGASGYWSYSVYTQKDKFNFQLYLKYPWSYKTPVFLLEKIQPLWGIACVKAKSWNTFWTYRTCYSLLLFPRSTPCFAIVTHTLLSDHPSLLPKCHCQTFSQMLYLVCVSLASPPPPSSSSSFPTACNNFHIVLWS
jgi:hypothetical protein